MVKKTHLTFDDVTESGFKILTVLTEWMTASQIAHHSALSTTTVRRLLQRMETFGLVKEELQVSETNLKVSSKHFNLTKDGCAFVKRIRKARDLCKPEKAVVVESVETPIASPRQEKGLQDEPFNIASWLRQKAQGLRVLADELTAMADDLSVYEE